jgi:uncharacterized membrane protein
MKSRNLVYAAALCLSLSLCSASPAGAATFITLDFPGALATRLWGINDLGQIVGDYSLSDGTDHGFLFDLAGGFTTIDDPNGDGSDNEARGINNSGEIVGFYIDKTDHFRHGYLYSQGTFTTIDVPVTGASNTLIYGINDNDEVVGQYIDSGTPAFHGFRLHLTDGAFATVDHPGGLTAPTGITNAPRTQISGTFGDGFNNHGFLISNGIFSTFDYPSAVSTQGYGMNRRTQIVGNYETTTPPATQGYLRDTNGSFKPIVYPNSNSTTPADINNFGVIVGNYNTLANLDYQGFVRIP